MTTIDVDQALARSAHEPLARSAASPSNARRIWGRLVRDPAAVTAMSYLLLLVLVAIFAPLLMPHDPDQQNLRNTLRGPFTSGHLLGTDEFGRDTLSRLISSTRIVLPATAQAVGVSIAIGVPFGLAAGYFGRWVDIVVMRICDTLQSFPMILLALGMIAAMGEGLGNAMIAVGVAFSPQFTRVVRAAVLEVREQAYVEASRSIGTPTFTIIRKRVLPNVLPPLLVLVSLAGGFALMAEASLSFLGVGVQLPQASWGLMLGKGYTHIHSQPWLVVFPGVAILITVLAFNVLGDSLRDAVGTDLMGRR